MPASFSGCFVLSKCVGKYHVIFSEFQQMCNLLIWSTFAWGANKISQVILCIWAYLGIPFSLDTQDVLLVHRLKLLWCWKDLHLEKSLHELVLEQSLPQSLYTNRALSLLCSGAGVSLEGTGKGKTNCCPCSRFPSLHITGVIQGKDKSLCCLITELRLELPKRS